MGSAQLEKSLGMKTIHQLGFVKLLDVMGDDEEVENSARISYGEGTRKVNQTRNLIRYLMRHKHTSPFEMCEVKFHLKLPIFIMRQLVRHRTANLNEYSGRYSVMSNEFYLPEGDYLAKQSTTNSQGRGEVLEQEGLLQFEFAGISKRSRPLWTSDDFRSACSCARTVGFSHGRAQFPTGTVGLCSPAGTVELSDSAGTVENSGLPGSIGYNFHFNWPLYLSTLSRPHSTYADK